MPARKQFTQRLSIAIVAVFIATMVIALAFATQPVGAKPGNGNGNPNPHKYTPTPTPDYPGQTATAAAGATQTRNATSTEFAVYILTHQSTWTQAAYDQETARAATNMAASATDAVLTQWAVGTMTASAVWKVTAQPPTPEP